MTQEGTGIRGRRRAKGGVCAVATALGTIGRLVFSCALIGFMVVLSMAGCASVPFFGLTSVKFEQADAKNPAVDILAFWQPSEGAGPNGVPVRGFGAQIYFFTQSKQTPVAVDGSVRVYLFDDHGTVKNQSEPVAVFDFDAAHWKSGAHNSALGAGYSVFVPYPRNDYHQATCSLRIRFKPTAGPTIYSPPSTVVLSGPPAKSDKADQPNIQPLPPQRQARAQFQDGAAASLNNLRDISPGPTARFAKCGSGQWHRRRHTDVACQRHRRSGQRSRTNGRLYG